MQGIQEQAYNNLIEKAKSTRGKIHMEYIVDYINELKQYRLDSHTCIMGQNGMGKTMIMLALGKKLNPDALEKNQIIYSFDGTGKLIDKLGELRGTPLLIDELNNYFHYRRSMDLAQIALFNMIELAREHSVPMIGCVRDVRRLNNNYRDGKVQLLIWTLDRFEKESHEIKSYALVFLGLPILEREDKFGMTLFQYARTFEDIRILAENYSETFIGYLFMDDIKKHITKEELDTYEKLKEEGIQHNRAKWKARLERKEAGGMNSREDRRRLIYGSREEDE